MAAEVGGLLADRSHAVLEGQQPDGSGAASIMSWWQSKVVATVTRLSKQRNTKITSVKLHCLQRLGEQFEARWRRAYEVRHLENQNRHKLGADDAKVTCARPMHHSLSEQQQQ